MASVAFETWWSRSEIAQPCIGPSERAFRISRSSVPCGRSRRSLVLWSGMSPSVFYRKRYSCRSWRGRRSKRLERGKQGSLLTTLGGDPPHQDVGDLAVFHP